MDVPDTIEREVILPVGREHVWAALTEPRGLAAWFGTRATVDLRTGGAVTFVWDDGDEQYTTTGVIEVVEPPRRFAFRWHVPDAQHNASLPDGPTTRVEFTLDDHAAGTRLRLVESGFASLPADFRERNARGWVRELGDLVGYLGAAAEERC